MPSWNLEKLLARLGVGSRKDCFRYIRNGLVQIEGVVVNDPRTTFATLPTEIMVGEESIPVVLELFVMLHKPVGYECSHRPQNHDSVFSLFPERFLAMGLQSVGRLDVDTTGLLLLSNQGNFIHSIESPRKGYGKVYEAHLVDPLEAVAQEQLLQGVALHHEKGLFQALDLQMVNERHVRITVGEGVYHQVKRMFAAVGNRVESLHRLAIGAVALPSDLPCGQWRWLTESECLALGVQRKES